MNTIYSTQAGRGFLSPLLKGIQSKTIVMLLMMIAPTAMAQVTNVNTSGNFATLQSAINDASTLAGHTLQLTSPLTEGLVTVSKAVTIDGNGQTLTSTSATWG